MQYRKQMRIMVVDDDEDIAELLKYNLEKQDFVVKTIVNSRQAINVACSFNPDLIILDIMMPHPNGIEICRTLRGLKRFQDTYIFFLTGQSEDWFQHAVLNTGGDDYIDKVIGLRTLTYKINSVLKKNYTIRKSIPELTIGTMKIDRRSETVSLNKHVVPLNHHEFELIFFFAQNPGRSISAEDLIHNLWGSELYLSDRSIEVFIRNLKRKIGVDLIRKCPGDLYRLSLSDS